MIPRSARLMPVLGIKDTVLIAEDRPVHTGFKPIDKILGGSLDSGTVLLYEGNLSYPAALRTGALLMLSSSPHPQHTISHVSGIGKDEEHLALDYQAWMSESDWEGILLSYKYCYYNDFSFYTATDALQILEKALYTRHDTALIVDHADAFLDTFTHDNAVLFTLGLADLAKRLRTTLVMSTSLGDDIGDGSRFRVHLNAMADVIVHVQSSADPNQVWVKLVKSAQGSYQVERPQPFYPGAPG